MLPERSFSPQPPDSSLSRNPLAHSEIPQRKNSRPDRPMTQAETDLFDANSYLIFAASKVYKVSGETKEDIQQVAALGLIKAAQRFDPKVGNNFATYAIPTMVGEIKRHYRDHAWTVRVGRGIKERMWALSQIAGPLSQELQREPTTAELAERMGVSEGKVIEAKMAWATYRPSSLQHTTPDGEEQEIQVQDPDVDVEKVALDKALLDVIKDLPEREQRIIRLRYYGDLTQEEIAKEIGVSQVHISRLIQSSLKILNTSLNETPSERRKRMAGQLHLVERPQQTTDPEDALVVNPAETEMTKGDQNLMLVASALDSKPLNNGTLVPAFRAGMQALSDGKIFAKNREEITDPERIVETVVSAYRSNDKRPKFKNLDSLNVISQALEEVSEIDKTAYDISLRFLGLASDHPEGPLALIKSTGRSEDVIRDAIKLLHSTVAHIVGYTS